MNDMLPENIKILVPVDGSENSNKALNYLTYPGQISDAISFIISPHGDIVFVDESDGFTANTAGIWPVTRAWRSLLRCNSSP